jgi:uncharacterized protein (TIGR03663 family)
VKGGLILGCSLLFVGLGALAFRLPRLGERPMHADEAVQAARFRELWLRGRYEYDPHEYHGPTLSYATLPAAWLRGPQNFAETTEDMYRMVPVAFGVGLVLLAVLFVDAVGKPAAVCAGVLTAISPAMVFYSRYYIHETLFVFFTTAAIASGWRYCRSGRLAWCLAAGVSVGLMQATKETSVLPLAAMAGALLAAVAWQRAARSPSDAGNRRIPRWHLALGLMAAVLVAAVLLSSFFRNPRGPLDGILTYLPWLGRAAGRSPHVHPWYFYLQILFAWRRAGGPWWSEGLVLFLAAAASLAALLPVAARLLPGANPFFARWTVAYTVLLSGLYAAIPYKTPWCLLGFLQPMMLLGGLGAVTLVRVTPHGPLKAVLVAALTVAAGQLGWQAYRASYVMAADPRNPYVYVHTLPDILRLAGDARQVAQASPEGDRVPLKVIWQDGFYWPLPWYLRGFERVEYWSQLPGDPAAPLVISSPSYDDALTKQLAATHLMTGYYAVRPNVFAQLWVRMDLWEAHLKRLGRL